MKTSTLLIGGTIGVAALWSAGWFMGKALYVEPEADKVVEQLRSGEVFFSFDVRTISGFPFGYDVSYENVKLSDGSLQWQWSAAEMKVGSGVTDAGSLVLTPAAESKLSIEATAFGGAPDTPPAVFDIASEGMEVRLSDADGGATVVAGATSLLATQVDGTSVISDGKLRFDDLDINLDATADFANVDSTMTAAEMEIVYRISLDGVVESNSASTLQDVKVAFSGEGVNTENLAQFIESGGTADFSYSAASYTGTGGNSGGPSAPPINVDIAGGLTTAVVSVRDGRVAYSADAADIDYDMKMEGPLEDGGATLSGMAMRFEMPVSASPDAGPYEIVMTLSELALDEPVWALFDPGRAIARTPMNVSIDLGGRVRILSGLGASSSGQSPVDVETLDIRDLSIDGAGVAAKVAGALDIAGNAALPDGDIKVEVSGALALIDKMATGGVIPQEAAELYKTLVQSYARPGPGPDDLIAEIEVDNGVVLVNGLPLQ
ncbi:MAG: DUF2125 domain-containing protein [Pseudomonadota bacterium]